MRIVKIGETRINLDAIAYVEQDAKRYQIVFAFGEPVMVTVGVEAGKALVALLDKGIELDVPDDYVRPPVKAH